MRQLIFNKNRHKITTNPISISKSKDKTVYSTMVSVCVENVTPKRTVIRHMFGRLALTSTNMRRSQQSKLQNCIEELLVPRNAADTTGSAWRNSTQSSYDCNPTRYQIACFGSVVTDAVQNNTNKLQSLFEGGVSPNPYDTKSRRFLVHIVCATVNVQALKLMIDFGGSKIVHCLDQFGRTPLHQLCWNNDEIISGNRLEMVKLLLQCHPQMLSVRDISGREPFSYVPKRQHSQWISFLNENKQIFSETTSKACEHFEPKRTTPPILTVEIAQMVVSGRMELSEIQLFHYNESLLDEIVDGKVDSDLEEVCDIANLDLTINVRNDFNDSCFTFGASDELANVLEYVSIEFHL
jgi:hypothetical protein